MDKGHIFWEGHKILSYVVTVKFTVDNFLAFSEYMNFTTQDFLWELGMKPRKYAGIENHHLFTLFAMPLSDLPKLLKTSLKPVHR